MEKNKTHIERHSLTFLVLYYWGKIIGINSLTLLKNNELVFSYFYLLYECTLCFVYCYSWYCQFLDRLVLRLPGETPIAIIADCIRLGATSLEASVTWLVFGFYPNRFKAIVKNFIKAETILIKFGISDDTEKHYQRLVTFLLIINTIYIGWTAITNTLLRNFPGMHYIAWILLDVSQIATLNTKTFIIWMILMVKWKLRQLNENIYFLMRNNNSETKKVNVDNSQEFVRHSSDNNDVLWNQIHIVSQLHHQLRDLIDRIIEHVAVIILSSIALHFTELTVSVYDLYQYLKGFETFENCNVIYIMVTIWWIITPAMVLFAISYACGSTSYEANRTGNILHALLNDIDNFGDPQNSPMFVVMALDLLQNKVRISLFGFFELNDIFFYSAMATATTYLTIMLQFYN